MTTEGAAGQDIAYLLEEFKRLNKKVDSIERELRRKDEQIKHLSEAAAKREQEVNSLKRQLKEKNEMQKKMDEYAEQIKKLKGEEKEEKGKNIFQSIVAYVKKHPRLIATAVAAGIIGGFLTLYGVPVVWGAAAITWKTAVAGGCVVSGATLLVGDVIVTETEKKMQ